MEMEQGCFKAGILAFQAAVWIPYTREVDNIQQDFMELLLG